jgi:hypothetical protein
MAAIGGLMGVLGVLIAALAVFLSGPPVLVRTARALAVLGLVVGAAGLLRELLSTGFQIEPSQGGGMGQGSLLAAGGMLMLTFGAARVAERRRATRDRARWMEEQRALRDR